MFDKTLPVCFTLYPDFSNSDNVIIASASVGGLARKEYFSHKTLISLGNFSEEYKLCIHAKSYEVLKRNCLQYFVFHEINISEFLKDKSVSLRNYFQTNTEYLGRRGHFD